MMISATPRGRTGATSTSSSVVSRRTATGAADPVGSGSMSSSWSAIKTIDVAPVPGEDAAVGYEMTPIWTSTGKDDVFHITIPPKYRRTSPGLLRIAVLDGAGRLTQEKAVTFSAMAIRATGRPSVALPTAVRTPAVTVPLAAVQGAPHAPGGVQAAPLSPSAPQALLQVKLTPLPKLSELPPDVAARGQRLVAHLPGLARPRYELARAEVLRSFPSWETCCS